MPRRRGVSPPAASTALVPLPQKRGRSSLSQLILRAVAACTARKGASLVFIKKALATEGYDVARNSGRLKAAVGALLSKGLLRRVTGSGVAGSFRIGKERVEGAGRSGRAAGKPRQRPAGKKKGPRRAVKASAQRLKKAKRRPGKAAEAAGGAQEAGGAAADGEA
ncbi:histone H1.4-like [Columba livia]|uniref:histone H1.4-like n=1 Tax=Columba livia TaxID=8932 RepID=UPI0031BA8929